jgi:hypothetical protein
LFSHTILPEDAMVVLVRWDCGGEIYLWEEVCACPSLVAQNVVGFVESAFWQSPRLEPGFGCEHHHGSGSKTERNSGSGEPEGKRMWVMEIV